MIQSNEWRGNMTYIITIIMLMIGYYTLTFGISLWRDDKNKLGSIGAIIIALAGTLVPVVELFLKM